MPRPLPPDFVLKLLDEIEDDLEGEVDEEEEEILAEMRRGLRGRRRIDYEGDDDLD